MPANPTFIQRHSVLIYFVLTLAISWGGLLMIMGPAAFLGAAEVPAESGPLLYVAMLLGPTIAGLLMTGLVRGHLGFSDLLSRLRLWRVSPGWYLIAIATAPSIVAVTLLLLARFSRTYVPGIITSADKIGIAVSGLIAAVLVGIFEEIGWTGFAIPRLRERHGILATGLIVGLVWGLWHLPLFTASARSSQSLPPLLTLAVLLFSFLPAFRVLMVWVYDGTRSVLVAMLMHAAQTATALILAIPAGDIPSVVFDLIYCAALWLIVIVILRARRAQPQLQAQTQAP